MDPHCATPEAYAIELDELVAKYGPQASSGESQLLKELDALNPVYVLDGVYMITAFEMSEAIFKLRVVGSKSASDFVEAIGYYTLWDIDAPASKVLKNVDSPKWNQQTNETNTKTVATTHYGTSTLVPEKFRSSKRPALGDLSAETSDKTEAKLIL